MVTELIKEDNRISTAELQKKLGLSERQLSRTIKLLKDDGVLERHGSTRSGYWVLIKE